MALEVMKEGIDMSLSEDRKQFHTTDMIFPNSMFSLNGVGVDGLDLRSCVQFESGGVGLLCPTREFEGVEERSQGK